MPDQQLAEQAPPVHAEVSYESSDAKLGPIACMGLGIVLLGLFAHVVCFWLFGVLKADEKRNDPGLPALAAKERARLSTDTTKIKEDLKKILPPLLQVDEPQDMSQFRGAEDKWLNSYGWTDAKSGKVRIPIAQAMRLLADTEIAKARGIRVEAAKGKEEQR
jgi:hypothetical protein